jgi:predicted kinase
VFIDHRGPDLPDGAGLAGQFVQDVPDWTGDLCWPGCPLARRPGRCGECLADHTAVNVIAVNVKRNGDCPASLGPVIIWINGGFGAGKTTLAEELHRRLPDALVYDPEDVGIMLWKWMRPAGDFQHLPSWRELVVATALSLRRHHAETLIVPMSLIRDAYRAEILGGLADAGEEVLHVFLEAGADVLRERLNARARVNHPDGDWEQTAREFGMTGVDEIVAAAARQPGGTLMLRSDRLTPVELADEVLARSQG